MRSHIITYLFICFRKFVGWVERSETQQNPKMLGFVPQPNLQRGDFLGLTEQHYITTYLFICFNADAEGY